MRRSIRLKEYDYSRPGAYFVTICAQNKKCLFGNIENTDMILNDAGKMVQTVWSEIPQHYKSIKIDVFTVMPNHIHGIIRITNQTNFNMPQNIAKPVGAGPRACPYADPKNYNKNQLNDETQSNNPKSTNIDKTLTKGKHGGIAPTVTVLSLPEIVQRFKSLTTKKYIDGVKQNGWQAFPGKLWQRNYYEHIIRDQNDYNHIFEYIIQNPIKWGLDSLNPETIDKRVPNP